MSDEAVDPEALEEQRLARTLSGAKMRGHNAYAASKAAPPKKVSTSTSPPPASKQQHSPVGRAPSTNKPTASGPMPEWKRAQMERDEVEKKRHEEEERRKKQYVDQIVTSVSSGHTTVESDSAVAPGTFVDPLSLKAPPKEEASPEPGRSILIDPELKAEELRREEEYMNRRTGQGPPKEKSKPKLVSAMTGHSDKDAHLGLNAHTKKLMVVLLDQSGAVIDEGSFILNKTGKLPVLAVENGMKVKNIIWKEKNEPIIAQPDGYSSQNFSSRELIEITGNRSYFKLV
jgi:hypothetical protein